MAMAMAMAMATAMALAMAMAMAMNGSEMKRHGLILWENDATGLKIIFKWSPGLNNLLNKNKKIEKDR